MLYRWFLGCGVPSIQRVLPELNFISSHVWYLTTILLFTETRLPPNRRSTFRTFILNVSLQLRHQFHKGFINIIPTKAYRTFRVKLTGASRFISISFAAEVDRVHGPRPNVQQNNLCWQISHLRMDHIRCSNCFLYRKYTSENTFFAA